MSGKEIVSKSWLVIKLERLTKKAKELSKIEKEIYYEPGPWTVLKLIILSYYMTIYTRIIPHYFDKMIYIDLLAGSGISKMKTGDCIVGSPIIASSLAHKPFDKILCAEEKEERIRALRARLERVVEKETELIFFERDCNKSIDDILEHVSNKNHFLAFIDCEGLDVSWNTMEKLLSYNGDIIFNFATSEVSRVKGVATTPTAPNYKGSQKKLRWFYGGDEWKNANTPEQLMETYKDKINKFREIVIPIQVKGGKGVGGYHYHLIYATRKTRKGSPWVRAIEGLKYKIEKNTGDSVNSAMRVLRGEIESLDFFFKEEEVSKVTIKKISDF